LDDAAFFTAHSDAVIGLLASYALSPEFAKLKFRVTRNDAFNYIMLYFSTEVPFSDYEISVALREAKFWLAYTTWDKATKRSERHRLTFDDLAALRAELERLKPFIAEVYREMPDWDWWGIEDSDEGGG
jgi:hypothetical protein